MSLAKKTIFLLIVGGVALLAAQEPVRQMAMDCICDFCMEIHALLGIS